MGGAHRAGKFTTAALACTAALAAAAGSASAAVLYDNGPIATGTSSLSGIAAQPGNQYSEVAHNAGDLTTANSVTGFSTAPGVAQLADDFTVPAGQSWTISSFDTYGFINLLTSAGPPFVTGHLQIWNGRPGNVGSSVIFGDLTTNRLTSSTNANIVRIRNSIAPSPGAVVTEDRPVSTNRLAVSPALTLGAGTYWVEWAAGVSDGGGFAPLVTRAGERGRFTNNARGFNVSTATWGNLIDGGLPDSAIDYPQDLPFKLNGSRAQKVMPAVVTLSTEFKLRNTLTSGSADTTFTYGTRPQVPMMGDWNGDGTDTPGVYQGGIFKLRNTNSTGVPDAAHSYGDARGFPVAGDFDGDGTDDVATYRNGTWQVRFSNGTVSTITYGTGTWPATVPVTGDWDGDGTDGIGTYTYATAAWRLRNSPTTGAADLTFNYGTASSSYPVAGDWDSNGTDTVGTKTGITWALRNTNSAGALDLSFDYGAANDLPSAWSIPSS